MDTIIMDYHVFKISCTLCIGRELCALMELRNLMDKYIFPVQQNNGEVVGYLSLGKSGNLAKTMFYCLKQTTLFDTYYGKTGRQYRKW